MLLMIDNYDSFTFNLVQYLGELGEDVLVKRNDEVTLGEIEKQAFRWRQSRSLREKFRCLGCVWGTRLSGKPSAVELFTPRR